MQRSSRLSNVFFVFLGAASVGVVIGVLALLGVFEGDERVVREVERPASTEVSDSPAAEASVSEIYAEAAPAVAFIQAGGTGGTGGTGSGFLYDAQGHVVTNQHVVDGGTEFAVRLGEDGEALEAELVGADASTDLAVLEIDPQEVPAEVEPLELADSTDLRPGDAAIAIGSPFGLSGTVTSGIISALDRSIRSPAGFPISGVLQTDAAINPGNSGGPLLNADGDVIGVNSQIASAARQSSGVGFAVPSDTVRIVVPQLLEGGEIERAYLGVTTGSVQDESGAIVVSIAPDGPAAESDLRTGDRITRFGDRDIGDPSDLSSAVLERKPGDRVQLTVERGGEERTIEVQLGTRPDQIDLG